MHVAGALDRSSGARGAWPSKFWPASTPRPAPTASSRQLSGQRRRPAVAEGGWARFGGTAISWERASGVSDACRHASADRAARAAGGRACHPRRMRRSRRLSCSRRSWLSEEHCRCSRDSPARRSRRACCGRAASSGESRSRAPPTPPAALPAHSHPPAHTPRARTERSDTRALPHPQEFGHDEMKLLYQIYKDFLLDAATEDTVLEQWDDIQCGYDEPSCVAPCVLSCVRTVLCGRSAAVLRPLCINTALGRGMVL